MDSPYYNEMFNKTKGGLAITHKSLVEEEIRKTLGANPS